MSYLLYTGKHKVSKEMPSKKETPPMEEEPDYEREENEAKDTVLHSGASTPADPPPMGINIAVHKRPIQKEEEEEEDNTGSSDSSSRDSPTDSVISSSQKAFITEASVAASRRSKGSRVTIKSPLPTSSK